MRKPNQSMIDEAQAYVEYAAEISDTIDTAVINGITALCVVIVVCATAWAIWGWPW